MSAKEVDKERQRLAGLYKQMSDEELAEISADQNSLTDAAKEAARVELDRHRLDIKQSEVKEPKFALVRQFRDIGDVVVARSLLDSAGIEYLLGDEIVSSMSLSASGLVGGVKLFVKEEDAEVAEEILRGLEK